jgi:hypothetical protein
MSDTSTGGSDSAADGGAGETGAPEERAMEGRGAAAPAGDPDGPVVSGGDGARDVVVPIALYKRITAYSTLAAVVAVVLGFVMLDAATLQVSLVRRFIVGVVGAVGVVPPETVLTAFFSVLGLGLIVFGAGVYVLGSRFRAAGMGTENENAQDDDAEV